MKRMWIWNLVVVMLMGILIFVASMTFAWLSATWKTGKFSVNTSDLLYPTVEVWTYDEVSETKGWYKQNVSADNHDANVSTIGVFTETTYKPNSKLSLYFGTINNLVQEQENTPVYVKYIIESKQGVTNDVIINYDVTSDYLSIYKSDITTGLGTKLTDSYVTDLNNQTDYPFLNLTYVVSDTNYNISNTDNSDLPDGFEDMFDTGESYSSTNNSFEKTLAEGTTKFYLYIRFTISPTVLRKALQDTELKRDMPAYLIFDISFGLEIRTYVKDE